MYYIFSLLIIAAAAFFAVAHFVLFKKTELQKSARGIKGYESSKKTVREGSVKHAKILKYISLTFSAAGILLAGAVILLLNLKLGRSGLSEEYISWARDTFMGYVRFGTLFFLIVSALSLLSFFADRKHKAVRVLLSLFSAVIILIAGMLYSYVASNDTVALSAYVQYFSMGMSAAIVFPFALDFWRTENILSDKGE